MGVAAAEVAAVAARLALHWGALEIAVKGFLEELEALETLAPALGSSSSLNCSSCSCNRVG
jgi:FPC/CPF motif-containing protein YcgG